MRSRRKVAADWLRERADRKPVALAFARIEGEAGPCVVTIIFHAPCGCNSKGEDE